MKTEIYIHIPFCVKKCAYCDFLSFPAEKEQQRRYVDMLLREIRQAGSEAPPEAVSVFLGGGTPSILPAEWIGEILETLGECFGIRGGAEVTIEVNPGTADAGKLKAYRAAGISRISFGCQSFHDEELKRLGRIHTAGEIRESVKLAREAGFSNLSLDLMSGLPGQSLSAWEDTLRQAVSLEPEHISAYSLMIEEGTPFYAYYGPEGSGEDRCAGCGTEGGFMNGPSKAGPAREKDSRLPPLPDEETERRMYERTEEILAEAGYRQYEISNYAKEGFACRHNLGYWTGVPYYGFGLGASGYLPRERFAALQQAPDRTGSTGEPEVLRVRYRNTADMEEYLAGNCGPAEVQALDARDLQAEFMILGLRLTEGVKDALFAEQFGQTPDSVYGEVLDRYVKSGFLIREGGRTRLSRRGISVSNRILAEFL